MPRQRTLKPEFWGHPNPPSFEARLLYMAMWTWANDYGAGDASPKAVVGFAFPNDDDIDHHDVERMFAEISKSYDCVFYIVEGRPYYEILSWSEHHHPKNPGVDNKPHHVDAEQLLYQGVSQSSVDPTPGSTQGLPRLGYGLPP